MSVDFGQLVDDLAAEQDAIGEVLSSLASAEWDEATHAPGWQVRDQVAHLAFFDEQATLAMRDTEAFKKAAAGAEDFQRDYLARGRAMTPEELLGWWRSASGGVVAGARPLDRKTRLPWYGPDMSAMSFVTARLMETWSHGLDVVDVVKAERPDTDRLQHVATLGVRTRAFSYVNRGLEPSSVAVRVELTSPSGEVWTFGEDDVPDRIAGSASDFCRVVTQRRHLADTSLVIEGAAAQEWMEMAQAFAGPPGEGRQPGEFSEAKGAARDA